MKTFTNVTDYILHDKTYDLYIDFENAFISNPKYYYDGKFLRIEIDGENVDFQTSQAALNFLNKYIDIKIGVKNE